MKYRHTHQPSSRSCCYLSQCPTTLHPGRRGGMNESWHGFVRHSVQTNRVRDEMWSMFCATQSWLLFEKRLQRLVCSGLLGFSDIQYVSGQCTSKIHFQWWSFSSYAAPYPCNHLYAWRYLWKGRSRSGKGGKSLYRRWRSSLQYLQLLKNVFLRNVKREAEKTSFMESPEWYTLFPASSDAWPFIHFGTNLWGSNALEACW